MRIFKGFLVLFTVAILWMLPVSEAVYDYRTYVEIDNFNVDTGVGVSTASVTLQKFIYEADTDTLSITSNLSSDSPVFVSYNATSRAVAMSSLSANATRQLSLSYDVGALANNPAIDTFMDWLPTLWILILIAFPGCAVIVIWKERD